MARRREPRRLSDAERALWRKVAETTAPLHTTPTIRAAVSPPTPVGHAPEPLLPGSGLRGVGANAKASTAIPAFRIGERVPAARLYTNPGPALLGTRVAMDKRAFTRMMRGRLKPEARIDLHGMTLAEAQPVLSGFIMRAAGQGKRLVLVITGKGRQGADIGPIPVRRGVLRHQVPLWLAAPPLGALVLQVAEAHASHGGGGALYVYLSRAL